MRYFIFVSLIILLFSCTPKVVKEPPPKTEQQEIKYLWAYKQTANVRSSNSSGSNKIASLTDGDSVKVLRNDNGWYEIQLNNGTNGWIRSDLLGTKNMSVFSKAISFSHDLKEKENTTLFFDKKIQHKRIFLELSPNEYSSKSNIEKKAREIGGKYQKSVYTGNLMIQVIKPENQSEYLRINLPGSPTADISLPVFEFGILEEVNLQNQDELKLVIAVNENINNTDMLKEARKIAASFPLTLTEVNVTFKNKSQDCLLSFIEDAAGENYKFNQCL